MARTARPTGKLAKVIDALTALLDADDPDAGQVLLKSNSAAKMAGGNALRDMIGETRWARLQEILHPQKKPADKQLAAAA